MFSLKNIMLSIKHIDIGFWDLGFGIWFTNWNSHNSQSVEMRNDYFLKKSNKG